MKLMFTAIAIVFSTAAFADHNLGDAMSDNADISQRVFDVEEENGVVCDVIGSEQSYYYEDEAGKFGTAWRQTAQCYSDVTYNEDGQAVWGEVKGILIVSYTWENYSPGEVLELVFIPAE